ncbi:hypothetical protein B0I35DRAFT_362550 [Stachybotrys elegans]|uniref:S1-like domain-containing protein n=1 Tax=Stachybotrys elegans TaxID=80388 RepID=A0A8K0WL46_9HYPO|nr:hypothetical protein B0I35DRAFT_362550 [Stachybotrys elegans]
MPKNKGKVRPFLLASPHNPAPTFPPFASFVAVIHVLVLVFFSISFPLQQPLLTRLFQGGKNRRRGTKENDDQRRELTFKEDGQEYAQVIKMLGNGRLEALCFDGSKRLANIRGKMRKKVWINQGDIILLSLRDFQDGKGDVILKYTADEARTLKSYGELPEHAKINEGDTFGQGEDGEAYFEFGDADSDDESEDEANPNSGKKEVDIDDI